MDVGKHASRQYTLDKVVNSGSTVWTKHNGSFLACLSFIR